MRRALALMLLVLLVASLACHGNGRRNLRPAEVQIYDLPPADAAWTLNPPEYPKSEGLTQSTKGKDANSGPKVSGPGGGGFGSGPGMGAGLN